MPDNSARDEGVLGWPVGSGQVLIESLVRPRSVIVGEELLENADEVTSAEDQKSGRAALGAGTKPPTASGVRVSAKRPSRCATAGPQGFGVSEVALLPPLAVTLFTRQWVDL